MNNTEDKQVNRRRTGRSCKNKCSMREAHNRIFWPCGKKNVENLEKDSLRQSARIKQVSKLLAVAAKKAQGRNKKRIMLATVQS